MIVVWTPTGSLRDESEKSGEMERERRGEGRGKRKETTVLLKEPLGPPFASGVSLAEGRFVRSPSFPQCPIPSILIECPEVFGL